MKDESSNALVLVFEDEISKISFVDINQSLNSLKPLIFVVKTGKLYNGSLSKSDLECLSKKSPEDKTLWLKSKDNNDFYCLSSNDDNSNTFGLTYKKEVLKKVNKIADYLRDLGVRKCTIKASEKIDSKNKHTHDFNATLGETLTTKESNNPSNNETNKEDKKKSVGGNASLDINYDFKNDAKQEIKQEIEWEFENSIEVGLDNLKKIEEKLKGEKLTDVNIFKNIIDAQKNKNKLKARFFLSAETISDINSTFDLAFRLNVKINAPIFEKNYNASAEYKKIKNAYESAFQELEIEIEM